MFPCYVGYTAIWNFTIRECRRTA